MSVESGNTIHASIDLAVKAASNSVTRQGAQTSMPKVEKIQQGKRPL